MVLGAVSVHWIVHGSGISIGALDIRWFGSSIGALDSTWFWEQYQCTG